MAKIELKQPIVAEISELIKDAQSAVLVDYRGLTVEQDTKLRKEMREAGVTYKVYKNTYMNFAFKGTDFEALAPYLEGPSAIAVSKDDATAPARILGKQAKEIQALEIKGGVVEGTAYDALTAYFITDSGEIISNRKMIQLTEPDKDVTVGFILNSGIDFTSMKKCFMRFDFQGETLGDIPFKMNISFFSDF